MNHDAFINHLTGIPSLDSIPAADIPARFSSNTTTAPASAAVAGQGVIGFVEGMSQQAREDVLDSFTYATLAADKRYDLVTENGEWYRTFRGAMTRALNWTAQDVSYTSYSSREQVLTMDKVGLKLIANSLSAAAAGIGAGALMLQIAEQAVEALKTKDEPLRLFDSRTTKPNGARFLVGGCRESQDGVIVLSVGAVEARTALSVGNVLFFNWNSVSIDLHQSADIFVFNQSLYAQRRQQVRNALSSAADAAFEEFPI
ncbi:hypothetical protein ACI2KS_16780 [Pseudomonas sp. NPDC087358]|uniref:hypothetical protein n=1 Tax=Pseudomonas sp. NPDC087358 TaxID=3364439 RepID=UPI00384D7996